MVWWINWLRSGSQLVAGLKITMAFLSYVGIGQIGKWLIETFYPFTRLMWRDFFAWLELPDISNIEKDALTALIFFLPLGVSSILSYLFGHNHGNIDKIDRRSDIITAIIFGGLFFLLLCGSLLARLMD